MLFRIKSLTLFYTSMTHQPFMLVEIFEQVYFMSLTLHHLNIKDTYNPLSNIYKELSFQISMQLYEMIDLTFFTQK